MNVKENHLLSNYLSITSLGMFRGVIVGTTGYPLEVIKIKQQTDLSDQKSSKLAGQIFKSEGIRGLYRGFKPYMTRLLFRQLWLWPTIMKIHSELKRKEFHPISNHIITGGLISTIDAFTGISMEKAKTLSILRDQKPPIEKKAKEPFLRLFQGLGTHWTQLSVSWTCFLVFQELFKNSYKDRSLTPPKIT